MWQAGVVARSSGWIRDGVGLLCEERQGNGSRGERKDLRRGWRDAEVACVSKHGDGSRLGLWFHAAYSRERRRSAELDLGSRKPLDHMHRSTAHGTDPGSESAHRARSWRIVGVGFLHRVQ